MTGVDPLGPGRLMTHFTFSVLLKRSGKPVSVLEPSKFGPRHCAQFSANAVPANNIPASKTCVCFMVSLLKR
jgi:hypothetical protein